MTCRLLPRLFRPHAWLAAVLLWAMAAVPAPSATRHGLDASDCGSGTGRILEELHRHRQAQLHRPDRAALAPQAARILRDDIGDIAIVETGGGVLVERNLFDLGGQGLVLTPSPQGYTASPVPLAFDEEARGNGVALDLGDDDAHVAALPFEFPFFGEDYPELFVHSDGNLTFVEPEASSTSRSLTRAVSGPPRIMPFFTDLDPTRGEAVISTQASAGRFTVTWNETPEFTPFGVGRRQTFQAVLHQDGRIEFHYAVISLDSAVVGVTPGRLAAETTAADFSESVDEPAPGTLAEIFSQTTAIDVFSAARQFFRNHEDAYDFIVIYNNFGQSPGPSVFAFETTIRNHTTGVGEILPGALMFDFGPVTGSDRRLQALVNMGPLSQYPADPEGSIMRLPENTPLSVLGHEVGHRYLAYTRFLDPELGFPSYALLGRGDAHWSFFFNSDASFLEGHLIEDRGMGVMGRFLTVEVAERYSLLDQYLWGFLDPEQVPATFLVTDPSIGPSPGSAPQSGVTFDGLRKEIMLDQIIAAEGPRVPERDVSQKEYNVAFLLVVRPDETPSQSELDKLNVFRTEFEPFFEESADGGGRVHTELVRELHLSTWPAAGVLAGVPGRGRVEIAAPIEMDLEVTLLPGSGVIETPAAATIPAGSTAAEFPVTGAEPGIANLNAEASLPGYDTARTIVEVRSAADELTLQAVSGGGQAGGQGGVLAEPVVFRVVDENRLPFSGVPVTLSASGDGAVTPSRAVTDAFGRVAAEWRLASSGGANVLTASLEGAPGTTASVDALAAGPLPAFAQAGVVNAASFNLGPSAANRAIAPGGLVSIFGQGLAVDTAIASAFPLPTTLAGTTVTLNGRRASLLFVSPSQINLQAPFELAGETAGIVITTPAGPSSAIEVPLGPLQPGVFFDPATGAGAILNNEDRVPVTDRPASPGGVIEVFATGLGPVTPAVRTGLAAPASPVSETAAQPQAFLGGRQAPVLFSGLAPFFAGLYQLNVEVPADLPPGTHTLSVSVEGLSSNEVTIEVR